MPEIQLPPLLPANLAQIGPQFLELLNHIATARNVDESTLRIRAKTLGNLAAPSGYAFVALAGNDSRMSQGWKRSSGRGWNYINTRSYSRSLFVGDLLIPDPEPTYFVREGEIDRWTFRCIALLGLRAHNDQQKPFRPSNVRLHLGERGLRNLRITEIDALDPYFSSLHPLCLPKRSD